MERGVAEREWSGERGVTEICLSGEQIFRRSRSAHCSGDNNLSLFGIGMSASYVMLKIKLIAY